MKFTEYEINPHPGKMLTILLALGLILAPLSNPIARPKPPPDPPTPVYDYRDFAGLNVSERIFVEIAGVNGATYEVLETVTQLPEPGEILVERVHSYSAEVTAMHYVAGDTEYVLDWEEDRLEDGTLSRRTAYNPPLSVQQVHMPKGAMQGGGAAATVTMTGFAWEEASTFVNVALGVDDIEVPYGPISGCLRMFEERDEYSYISWYCPGIGLAKRVWGGGFGRISELKSVTFSSVP